MSTPTTYRGTNGDAGEELTALPIVWTQLPAPFAVGVILSMTRTDPMRRRFPAALFLASLLLILALGPAAMQFPARAREADVSPRVCRIDWRKGPWQVKKLIRCAENRWSVPGGAPTALYVANRESNFKPKAYNGSSGASGIFQHLRRYWPGRADTFGFRGWSAFNARANIMVTMRMVHRMGSWSHWGI